MWIVVKYKTKELKTLKSSFFRALGEMPIFYSPRIQYQKYINNKLKVYEKNILDNYLICKHDKFSDTKIGLIV